MGEDGLSPPTAMDAAWAELADILGAVFVDVGKLVRAVVAFLSAPVTAAPSARGSPDPAATGDDHARLTSFPNHNQIHVLGNLLQLPVMKREPYCHALSFLLPNDGTPPVAYRRTPPPTCWLTFAVWRPQSTGVSLLRSARWEQRRRRRRRRPTGGRCRLRPWATWPAWCA